MDISREQRRRGDHGQITTGLVLVVSVSLVGFAVLGLALVGRATSEKSRAQTAADAAALAGASELLVDLPNIIGLLSSLNDNLLNHVLGCDNAEYQAGVYAQKNGAHVTTFECSPIDGEVHVEVALDEPVSDDFGPAEAAATAETGLDLGSCGFGDPEPQEPPETEEPEDPDDEPTDGPSEPPPPPPDSDVTFECGPLSIPFVVDGETGVLTPPDLRDVVINLEPSLTE